MSLITLTDVAIQEARAATEGPRVFLDRPVSFTPPVVVGPYGSRKTRVTLGEPRWYVRFDWPRTARRAWIRAMLLRCDPARRVR